MIEDIRRKFRKRKYEYSQHAVDQGMIRHIAEHEVMEDYPDDKYGPSCLIYGRTLRGRHLHVQCSYPSRPLIKVITNYAPDPDEWEDFMKRRKTS